jgi:hypothetical protein
VAATIFLGINGNLASQVIESSAGNMARWIFVTLPGRHGAKITNECTNKTVDTSVMSGPTTATALYAKTTTMRNLTAPSRVLKNPMDIHPQIQIQ